jgi:hypothetical protein
MSIPSASNLTRSTIANLTEPTLDTCATLLILQRYSAATGPTNVPDLLIRSGFCPNDQFPNHWQCQTPHTEHVLDETGHLRGGGHCALFRSAPGLGPIRQSIVSTDVCPATAKPTCHARFTGGRQPGANSHLTLHFPAGAAATGQSSDPTAQGEAHTFTKGPCAPAGLHELYLKGLSLPNFPLLSNSHH